MRRRLAALAVLSALAFAPNAQAAPNDPVGDLITSLVSGTLPGTGVFNVKATLYHAGAKGVGGLDSLGCKVVPMRTIAVDKTIIPRRTVIFIKETVIDGKPQPNEDRITIKSGESRIIIERGRIARVSRSGPGSAKEG